MSDAQLACLAIAAAPLVVGALWALGDLAGHVAAQKRPPSPRRVLRLCLAGPFFFLVAAVVLLLEVIDDANIALHACASRAALGLRSWMAA